MWENKLWKSEFWLAIIKTTQHEEVQWQHMND